MKYVICVMYKCFVHQAISVKEHGKVRGEFHAQKGSFWTDKTKMKFSWQYYVYMPSVKWQWTPLSIFGHETCGQSMGNIKLNHAHFLITLPNSENSSSFHWMLWLSG
jgi:hypothetical protein